jgi:hypothetical protein
MILIRLHKDTDPTGLYNNNFYNLIWPRLLDVLKYGKRKKN